MSTRCETNRIWNVLGCSCYNRRRGAPKARGSRRGRQTHDGTGRAGKATPRETEPESTGPRDGGRAERVRPGTDRAGQEIGPATEHRGGDRQRSRRHRQRTGGTAGKCERECGESGDKATDEEGREEEGKRNPMTAVSDFGRRGKGGGG